MKKVFLSWSLLVLTLTGFAATSHAACTGAEAEKVLLTEVTDLYDRTFKLIGIGAQNLRSNTGFMAGTSIPDMFVLISLDRLAYEIPGNKKSKVLSKETWIHMGIFDANTCELKAHAGRDVYKK